MGKLTTFRLISTVEAYWAVIFAIRRCDDFELYPDVLKEQFGMTRRFRMVLESRQREIFAIAGVIFCVPGLRAFGVTNTEKQRS